MKSSRLLFALLLSIAIALIFYEPVMVDANPFPGYPSVRINSPTNSTYYSDSLTLDVIANTRFDNYTELTTRTISYSLDEKPSVPINNLQYKYFEINSTSTVTCSALLSNLSNGTHKLVVSAKYQYKVYTYAATPRPTDSYIIQNYTSKATAIFSIDTNNNSPSPISSLSPSYTAIPTTNTGPDPISINYLPFVLGLFAILAIFVVAVLLYRRNQNQVKKV
jgi:hypothetical protein